MPIEFDCPACLTVLKVPSESAGKMARCPHCQTVMNIPGEQEPVEPPQEFESPVQPKPTYPPQKSVPTRPMDPPLAWERPAPHPPSQIDVQINPYGPTAYAPHPHRDNFTEVGRRIIAAGVTLLVASLVSSVLFGIALAGELMWEFDGNEDLGRTVLVGIFCTQLCGVVAGSMLIARKYFVVCFLGTLIYMLGGICCCAIPTSIGIFPLIVMLDAFARGMFYVQR